ncbi:hypothetical protein HMPREF0290_0839 [Corynebacterium efficiens YS-314]|nr:hypothetical protein HMPREF0290_0839 [Corynebacterium efficiens YS-314]
MTRWRVLGWTRMETFRRDEKTVTGKVRGNFCRHPVMRAFGGSV